MEERIYNGFATEEQYVAVKEEVKNCLEWTIYENDFEISYDEGREIVVVKLGWAYYFFVEICDNGISSIEFKNRNEIWGEEFEAISALNNFDWSVVEAEEEA